MQKQKVQLSDFSMLSLLGIGNYAKVVLVRKKSNGKIYAMKIVRKKKIAQGDGVVIKKNHAFIERQILTQCAHPFLIKMHGTFQHQKKLYYILQYCPGGQLFGLIKRLKRISEHAAKFYAAQILLALEHLHSHHFVFRDLKPENVMLDRRGYIRLIDFGLSCKLDGGKEMDRIAGTPEYMPPEIFQTQVNVGVFSDWWAFGNIIFEMLVGFPPFFTSNSNIETIKHKICKEDPPLHFINNPILLDLLTKLLHKDYRLRLGSNSCDQIKNHPWFHSINWEKLYQQEIQAPFIPELASEIDVRWFQVQGEGKLAQQQEQDKQKEGGEKYAEFSLSWKSGSGGSQGLSLKGASPTQIVIDIQQKEQKVEEKNQQNTNSMLNELSLQQKKKASSAIYPTEHQIIQFQCVTVPPESNEKS